MPDLKVKIEQLIVGLGLTSTRFADHIGINRPIISHILSGRNKPSLEIIQRIVSKFPDLGFEWISDDAELDLKLVEQIANSQEFNDLFHAFPNARELNGNKNLDHNAENSILKDKKITKILVFYDDNTFTQFNPS